MFDSDDNEMETTLVVTFDPTFLNAADYLAAKVQRQFPLLHVEKPQPPITEEDDEEDDLDDFVVQDRPQLTFILPSQGPYSIRDVDNFAFELMERILWHTYFEIMVAYTVEQANDESNEENH
jgi:hypothetical protein